MSTLPLPGRTPQGRAVADESPPHLDAHYASAIVAITDALAGLEQQIASLHGEFLVEADQYKANLECIHRHLRDDLETLIIQEPRAVYAQRQAR